MAEIVFGDNVIGISEDTKSFSTRATIPDYRLGVNKIWWVDITIQLNNQTGQVIWTFRTLDPDTGHPPTDPLAGFLPPNDPQTGRGEGHAIFSIQPRLDLARGTVLTNRASITFDTEVSITTNDVMNTIGEPSLPVYLPIILRN